MGGIWGSYRGEGGPSILGGGIQGSYGGGSYRGGGCPSVMGGIRGSYRSEEGPIGQRGVPVLWGGSGGPIVEGGSHCHGGDPGLL